MVDDPSVPKAGVRVLIRQCHYEGGSAQAVDHLHHLLQLGDIVRVQGDPGPVTVRGYPTIDARHVDVVSLQLSPARVLALLADAQNGRQGVTRADACRLLGLSPRLWAPVEQLLEERLRRREIQVDRQQQREADPSTRGGSSEAEDGQGRAQRLAAAIGRRQRLLYVVLERLRDVHTLAAVMRTCDAFGVTRVLLVNPLVEVRGGALRDSSASAVFWVELEEFASVESCKAYLDGIEGGVRSFATVVPSERSSGLHHTDFCSEGKGVALWFGNESDGLSAEALEYCDAHVSVPMRGGGESLTASVSVGVACAEVTGQRLRAWPEKEHQHWHWALSPAEQQATVQQLLAAKQLSRRPKRLRRNKPAKRRGTARMEPNKIYEY